MDSSIFSNPIILAIGGMVLLILLYMWNSYNTKISRSRNRRSFRKRYKDKKKENKQ